MNYTITGRLLRGEETPRFEATLSSATSGQKIASIVSDGRGGCARVTWHVQAPALREATRAWFADEARRLYPEFADSPFVDPLHESAILVVPYMLAEWKRRVS